MHILSAVMFFFLIIFRCHFLSSVPNEIFTGEKEAFRRWKTGKLKVTGNKLSVSSDGTKSIEYPRAQLGNCFRGCNVYFFLFFFLSLLSDSSSTPLPVDERRNQLREAPGGGLRFFFAASSCWLYRRAGCFFEKLHKHGLNDRANSSKFEGKRCRRKILRFGVNTRNYDIYVLYTAIKKEISCRNKTLRIKWIANKFLSFLIFDS